MMRVYLIRTYVQMLNIWMVMATSLTFGCQKGWVSPSNSYFCFKKTPKPHHLQCNKNSWFFAHDLDVSKEHAVCTDQGKKIFIPEMPATLMKNGASTSGKIADEKIVTGEFPPPPKKKSPSWFPKKKSSLTWLVYFFVGYCLEAIWLFELWCPPLSYGRAPFLITLRT